MIRKLLVITGLALFALTGTTALSSCEKDPASLNDTITFQDLNAPYVPLTPTVALTPTSSVTFYAKSNAMSNSNYKIYVFIDGNFVSSISGITSSGSTPSCGTFGNVTTTLTTGLHTWFATSDGFSSYGSQSSPRSVNVLTTTTCNKVEVF
jgi:hypothetical protein